MCNERADHDRRRCPAEHKRLFDAQVLKRMSGVQEKSQFLSQASTNRFISPRALCLCRLRTVHGASSKQQPCDSIRWDSRGLRGAKACPHSCHRARIAVIESLGESHPPIRPEPWDARPQVPKARVARLKER